MNAYVISVLVAIVAMIIAIIASNSVAYKLGAGSGDVTARRIWFWTMAILTPVVSFAIGFVLVYMAARGSAHKAAALQSMCIGAAISFVLYVVVGWILSKIFNTKKIGTWFYSKK